MFLFHPQWLFAPILTEASSRMLETLVAGKRGLVGVERLGGFELGKVRHFSKVWKETEFARSKRLYPKKLREFPGINMLRKDWQDNHLPK